MGHDSFAGSVVIEWVGFGLLGGARLVIHGLTPYNYGTGPLFRQRKSLEHTRSLLGSRVAAGNPLAIDFAFGRTFAGSQTVAASGASPSVSVVVAHQRTNPERSPEACR